MTRRWRWFGWFRADPKIEAEYQEAKALREQSRMAVQASNARLSDNLDKLGTSMDALLTDLATNGRYPGIVRTHK